MDYHKAENRIVKALKRMTPRQWAVAALVALSAVILVLSL